MTENQSLHINSGSTHLEMRRLGPDSVLVVLMDEGVSAQADIDSSIMGVGGMLFRLMADKWQGWPGELAWRSVDGALRMSADRDGAGHVHLSVQLFSGQERARWQVEITLGLEAGQLDRLRDEVVRFEGFESAAA
jgi:hypothetical protein